MSGIIDFILGYILILIFWVILNMFFYALSLVTRKGFFFIPFAINIILNWAIQMFLIGSYLYSYIWKPLVSKEWLALVFSLIFGSFIVGLWQMIYGFLTAPIFGITTYFSEKAAQKINKKPEEFDYEVISPEGKTIGRYQSSDKTQKNLALWFTLTFIILFVRQFTTTWSDNSFGPIWFVIIPMFVIIVSTFVIGVFVGIFNLIKIRRFFDEDKYRYFAKTLKIVTIVYSLSFIFELLTK